MLPSAFVDTALRDRRKASPVLRASITVIDCRCLRHDCHRPASRLARRSGSRGPWTSDWWAPASMRSSTVRAWQLAFSPRTAGFVPSTACLSGFAMASPLIIGCWTLRVMRVSPVSCRARARSSSAPRTTPMPRTRPSVRQRLLRSSTEPSPRCPRCVGRGYGKRRLHPLVLQSPRQRGRSHRIARCDRGMGIMENLPDPTLTPASIACANFVLMRQLHALFARSGTTVAACV